jgi:ring-1,2-phenylacetyl-CoA epoxidase subunit PaaE
VSQFHSLKISDIRRETPDCVSISFDIPPSLSSLFAFRAGQSITLKLPVNGEELRRSYSICSSPADKELRIAVKHIPRGKFSAHANTGLKAGDAIEVMAPSGRFSITPNEAQASNYLAFAAGSGITPVISILKTVLTEEPRSTFTLIYGNKNRGSIIFKEQLEALKNLYMDRLVVHHVLSREVMEAPVHQGRIDEEKCETMAKYLFRLGDMDHCFICGPEKMIFAVRDWLLQKGMKPAQVHFELFNVPGESAPAAQVARKLQSGTSHVRLKLDGAWMSFDMPVEGMSLLDSALQHGADLPYSCKGGVCATCRAKLLEGKVDMDSNYALEQDELDAGFILTCQSHPVSENIAVDFDARG